MPPPNVVLYMPDQLSAEVLRGYADLFPEPNVFRPETPHLDRFASESMRLRQNLSTCPVCTPFRAMLQTGRHPQATGHVMNSVRTRTDEVGLADAFADAGYDTAYIGKWHLHVGAWPATNVPDFVPANRSRLGWVHWRAYNQHMLYFDGPFHGGTDRDWDFERWSGYECDALNRLAFEFLDETADGRAGPDGRPFLMMISPHPPHDTHRRPPFFDADQLAHADGTGAEFAPARFYAGLPPADAMPVPAGIPADHRDEYRAMSRHYAAMVRAVDASFGELLADLDRRGLRDNTVVAFLSDHGNQAFGGGHGPYFFAKKLPTEACVCVPGYVRWPGVLPAGADDAGVHTPADWFPSLCGLAGVAVPDTVEGTDRSPVWRGEAAADPDAAALTMNFSAAYDHLADGDEWRGVRRGRWHYARWRDGRRWLHDIAADPRQVANRIDEPELAALAAELEVELRRLMAERGEADGMIPACGGYAGWFDAERRVVANAWGALGPEALNPMALNSEAPGRSRDPTPTA